MRKTLATIYHSIVTLFGVLSCDICFWMKLTSKRQKREYDILQTAHRLEKGLLNENPKPLWGWDKAQRLATMLKDEKEGTFAAITGRAVLCAYIENKQKSSNPLEQEKVRTLQSKLPFSLGSSLGGALSVKNEDVLLSKEERLVCEKLFNTRHSVREFTKERVKREDIEAAVQMALRAPSACNRQPTRVYVFQESEQQSIYLTSDFRAFNIDEFNDWIVSPSIFAGYLSLTLHLYGIGSCIYRKPLYGNPSFMLEIRKKCHIPDSEKIIIELKFGYYKRNFMVAVSNRQKALDIINFCK